MILFNRAIELDPNRPHAWMCKGGLLLEVLHENEKSLEYFDKVIQMQPEFIIDALVFKGFALLGLGRNQEAQNLLVEATQMKPIQKDARGLYHQARAFALLKDKEKVIQNLKLAFVIGREHYRIENAKKDTFFTELLTEQEFKDLIL